MAQCSGCGGSCESCGGCAKALTLTPEEIAMLQKLAQIPFLPIARRADTMTAIYLEDTEQSIEEYAGIIACLEKKNLIDVDYRKPLSGFDYKAYTAYPVHGSMALTMRGQSVVELLELQGISEE